MTIPSKSWADIMDTQVDADSPLDTTLMMEIRDNLIYLKEWLGHNYTAARDHDHDGLNSKSVVLADGTVVTAKLADGNVTLAKLKMAQGSWTGQVGSNSQARITLNRYSHIYQSYADAVNERVYMAPQASFSTWQNGLAIYNSEATTVSAGLNWDYHTD